MEKEYCELIKRILAEGERRKTRNGYTLSIFGASLTVDLADGFPILQGRKIFYKGVFGELAAMLRGPKTVQDFKDQGCNYWDDWGDEQGRLSIDYGNQWHDFNGVSQIEMLKESLRNNPTDRRMIISSWRPDRLDQLSLPCCHYSYQFYVRDDAYLDMIWTQRSVDTMVGLPSDIVFAAAWLIAISREFYLVPGRIKFDLGDCHIYEEHIASGALQKYLDAYIESEPREITHMYIAPPGTDFCQFDPSALYLLDYNPKPAIKFELKV
jgi:thymidylate synthase